jgi:hypothetical protein
MNLITFANRPLAPLVQKETGAEKTRFFCPFQIVVRFSCCYLHDKNYDLNRLQNDNSHDHILVVP